MPLVRTASPFTATRLLALLTAAAAALAASCAHLPGIGAEDFGFGVPINHRLERVAECLAQHIEVDEQVNYASVRGSFTCTDKDAKYTVAYQDFDFNGRVDSVRVAPQAYRLAGVVLRGPGRSGRPEDFVVADYDREVARLKELVPSLKTAKGITFGSSFDDIRAAYGQDAYTQKLSGHKRTVAYREGDVYLLFALLEDRVVLMQVAKTEDPHHLFEGL
jgi:hypothetical protein